MSLKKRTTAPERGNKYYKHTSAGGLNECILIKAIEFESNNDQKEAIEAKNILENSIYQAEKMPDEYKDKISTLKNKLKQSKKYSTKKVFAFKLWFMDFMKITSVPIFYMIFPTKKYFVGDKKKIRKALKYNCIIAGNHFGPCDPMFMYMHFFSRRIKVIASEHLYDVKCLRFAFKRAGVIKYRRDTMHQIDVDAFKEALGTLEGNGVVGIFPEGHINFDDSFDNIIKSGSATLSRADIRESRLKF